MHKNRVLIMRAVFIYMEHAFAWETLGMGHTFVWNIPLHETYF